MSVENDRMVKMVSLYSIYSHVCLVSLDDWRANEDSDLPTLSSSPSLVLVFACVTVAPLINHPTIAFSRNFSRC